MTIPFGTFSPRLRLPLIAAPMLRISGVDLTAAACVRAREIVTTFSHTRPDGSLFFSIYDEFNISYAFRGENIAMGYGTPAAVMEGWMKSEGHRENILKDVYSAIGIGCYKKEGNIYWVQLFGGNY